MKVNDGMCEFPVLLITAVHLLNVIRKRQNYKNKTKKAKLLN